jgi:hypothetical protein
MCGGVGHGKVPHSEGISAMGMSRKRAGVEIAVTVGLLAGCVSSDSSVGAKMAASTEVTIVLCEYTAEGSFSGLAEASCPPEDEAPNPGYDPQPLRGGGTPLPEGLDYTRSVQCGGLLWALEGVSRRTTHLRGGPYRYKPEGKALLSMAGLYREWAGAIARQTGSDAAQAGATVLRDLKASRDDFLASAGTGTHEQKSATLAQAYSGDMAACRSTANAADYGIVVIAGG